MYGLVNIAIEKLVISEMGEKAWEDVCESIGLKDFPGFMALKNYPDELTYELVGAVSEKSGIKPEKILEMFGYYWVDYTKKEGYTDYLYLGGDSFSSFLQNLNKLHVKVKQVFPELRPPKFSVENINDNKIGLIYKSEREGLHHMVIGLLKGLADYFNDKIAIDTKILDGEVRFEIEIL